MAKMFVFLTSVICRLEKDAVILLDDKINKKNCSFYVLIYHSHCSLQYWYYDYENALSLVPNLASAAAIIGANMVSNHDVIFVHIPGTHFAA